MNESDHFAAAARQAGCPHGQMENFIRAGVILQSKQLAASAAARLCDLPGGPTAIGFGGAQWSMEVTKSLMKKEGLKLKLVMFKTGGEVRRYRFDRITGGGSMIQPPGIFLKEPLALVLAL